MIPSSSRPGDTNPTLLVTLGVLVGLVVAALIVIPLMMRPATQVDVTTSASSSTGRTASVAPAQQTPPASVEQSAIDACINAATEAHTQRWAQACNNERILMEHAYTACLENKDKEYCQAQFGSYATIGDDCQLPAKREIALNVQFAAAKAACQ